MMMHRMMTAGVLSVALAAAAPALLADQHGHDHAEPQAPQQQAPQQQAPDSAPGGMGMMGPGMGMMGHGMGMMGPGMGMMGHGMGMMGQDGMGMRGGRNLAAMLELTPEQQKQLREIRRDLHRQQWDPLGKLIEAREDLRELHQAERPDPAAIGEAHERAAQLERPVIEARVQARNEMHAVLTDEQREKLREMRRGMGGMEGVMGARGMMDHGMGSGMGMMGPDMGMPDLGVLLEGEAR
ncbi:Spy/CpxP family protein refolding chaperone [Ectothiorhodospiraceae bacterium 2226]|nr:Spy/CpxP family protein refolding chaperone [Ectothiorhodospiraceae bacterium 2226]